MSCFGECNSSFQKNLQVQINSKQNKKNCIINYTGRSAGRSFLKPFFFLFELTKVHIDFQPIIIQNYDGILHWCYTFVRVLHLNCTALNQSQSSNYMYIINLSISIYILLIHYLDINECDNGSNDCHVNANCTNTVGSFNCTCKVGYTGDGRICSGMLFKLQHIMRTPHFLCFLVFWLVLKLLVFDSSCGLSLL